MDINIFHGWSANGGWSRPPTPTSPADEEKMAEAIRGIRVLYNTGIPFYTKTSLQSTYRQLEKHVERGQKISIMGVDGDMVDFEIETGRILS